MNKQLRSALNVNIFSLKWQQAWVVLLLPATTMLFFIKTSHAQNTWTQKASLTGDGRFAAVSFSIGSKGYIGQALMEIIP
jgi:hypothetical protein